MNKRCFRKIAAAALVLGFSAGGTVALAGPTGSLGYTQLNDIDGLDIGAIYATAGFEFPIAPNITVTPELRAGVGVKDDSSFGVDFELSRLLGVATRVTYNARSGFYLYGIASLVNYEFKISGGGFSEKDDSTEFGIGAGAGFYFNERVGMELQYENVDSEDVISLGVRFRF